ncbi:hypothetical protein H5410_000276 [Solanum commersonii]|uniref:Uncharacterized protein n=1 Tax=Solanum commersonii TaxID=4109 RepID=A0A9J6AWR5_SOLCO|nr:hypothetical protein H5410_000276 [Solanum commersonii]
MLQRYLMQWLASRAGLLQEAYDFIKKIPFEADATALMGACTFHGAITQLCVYVHLILGSEHYCRSLCKLLFGAEA